MPRGEAPDGRYAATDRADVAELADALGLGPSAREGVGVRVPPSAPAAAAQVPLNQPRRAMTLSADTRITSGSTRPSTTNAAGESTPRTIEAKFMPK